MGGGDGTAGRSGAARARTGRRPPTAWRSATASKLAPISSRRGPYRTLRDDQVDRIVEHRRSGRTKRSPPPNSIPYPNPMGLPAPTLTVVGRRRPPHPLARRTSCAGGPKPDRLRSTFDSGVAQSSSASTAASRVGSWTAPSASGDLALDAPHRRRHARAARADNPEGRDDRPSCRSGRRGTRARRRDRARVKPSVSGRSGRRLQTYTFGAPAGLQRREHGGHDRRREHAGEQRPGPMTTWSATRDRRRRPPAG